MWLKVISIYGQQVRNTVGAFVDAEDFKKTLLTVKASKGLSWAEMGTLAGRARGTLISYAYGEKKLVSKMVAQDILKRLNGEPMPPTQLQRAEYTKQTKKVQADQRADSLRARKLAEKRTKVAELQIRILTGS